MRGSLRISLLLAATACILRPTNALVWFSILMPTLSGLLHQRAPLADYLVLLREAIVCGSAVLLMSLTSDYFYYGQWTFPPYQFLHFNISQNLAVFYGRNDWHYYLSQGLPLLLTTYLPHTLLALYQASSLPPSNIRFLFTTTILLALGSLSLIAHKEVRFIYPLLPLLHLVTAPTISSFFQASPPTPPTTSTTSSTAPKPTTKHKPFLYLMLASNLLIAAYTTLAHQSGILPLTTFLRHEYEALALDGRGRPLSSPLYGTNDDAFHHVQAHARAKAHHPSTHVAENTYNDSETFVAFLMPCHSTPWRSQLIHAGLHAWALTCEPPLHLAAHTSARAAYRDEADRFYDDPQRFLSEEVGGPARPWPRYVAGFAGIEADLKTFYEGHMPGFQVRERWRARNSHWHDDWRRTGDVVVWELVDGALGTE